MVLLHTAVSILGALVTVALVLALTRKTSAAAWGWIASFFPDLPVFWLSPLGAAHLDATLVVTHTLGVFVLPIILVIADILLIEMEWLGKLSFLPLPKNLRAIARAGKIVIRLEKYRAIPRSIRIQEVYVVGVVAGAVHLILNLAVGFF